MKPPSTHVSRRRRAVTRIACGGDGTIHDVIQELAGTQVALAILPFGTPMLSLTTWASTPPERRRTCWPSTAASAVSRSAESSIRLQRQARSPLLTVAAGIGVDAHLFYKLNSNLKKQGVWPPTI